MIISETADETAVSFRFETEAALGRYTCGSRGQDLGGVSVAPFAALSFHLHSSGRMVLNPQTNQLQALITG